MEVTFVQSNENYWKVIRHFTSPFKTFISVLVFAYVSFISLIIVGSPYFPNSILWPIAGKQAFLFCLALFLMNLLIRKRLVYVTLKKAPIVLGWMTVRMTSSGVYRLSELAETKITWQGFIAINFNKDGLLFFTTPNTPYIIPMDAFSNPSEAKAFYEAALSYWNAAKNTPPVMPTGLEQAPGSDQVWPPPPRVKS